MYGKPGDAVFQEEIFGGADGDLDGLGQVGTRNVRGSQPHGVVPRDDGRLQPSEADTGPREQAARHKTDEQAVSRVCAQRLKAQAGRGGHGAGAAGIQRAPVSHRREFVFEIRQPGQAQLVREEPDKRSVQTGPSVRTDGFGQQHAVLDSRRPIVHLYRSVRKPVEVIAGHESGRNIVDGLSAGLRSEPGVKDHEGLESRKIQVCPFGAVGGRDPVVEELCDSLGDFVSGAPVAVFLQRSVQKVAAVRILRKHGVFYIELPFGDLQIVVAQGLEVRFKIGSVVRRGVEGEDIVIADRIEGPEIEGAVSAGRPVVGIFHRKGHTDRQDAPGLLSALNVRRRWNETEKANGEKERKCRLLLRYSRLQPASGFNPPQPHDGFRPFEKSNEKQRKDKPFHCLRMRSRP